MQLGSMCFRVEGRRRSTRSGRQASGTRRYFIDQATAPTWEHPDGHVPPAEHDGGLG